MCSAGVCCQARCGVCQVCNLPGSVGSCRTAADGHPCPDAEPCNGGEVCQAGACVSGAPPRCDDDNPCTSDGCRAGTGCVHTALADGTRCSNGDVCDGEETCRAGVCKPGQPLGCDDGNPCTLDSCEPGKGCVSVRLADGTRCSNGDVCDGEEICQAGVCGPGRPLACDDANSCTTDSCHPLRGCQHARLADGTSCSGLDLCAGPGSCASGLCTGTGVRPLDCDDQNPCTTDTCRADAGCSHQAVADRTSCGDCLACAGGACLAAEDCAGGGGCALVGAAARHDRGWFWLLFWSVLLFACLLALLRARPARRWRRARPD
jgi:hypothetical protein